MSSRKEAFYDLMSKTLKVDPSVIHDELAIGDIPEWDSLAHMGLIAAFENAYSVKLDVEQIVDLEEVEDFLALLEEA